MVHLSSASEHRLHTGTTDPAASDCSLPRLALYPLLIFASKFLEAKFFVTGGTGSQHQAVETSPGYNSFVCHLSDGDTSYKKRMNSSSFLAMFLVISEVDLFWDLTRISLTRLIFALPEPKQS